MSRLSILLPALVFILGGEIPLSATPPSVAVVSPVDGLSRNSLASISGTAADADGVSAVELAVKRQSDGYYWDGGAFVSAQTWVAAVWTDPTWSYATVPALAEGETYSVYARAQDTLTEWSTTYSTSVFHAMPGCGSLVTVKNGAGADFNFIQDAVDSLSKNLTGDACVVVTNDGSYSEEVTVKNFTTNGYRLKIMREPGGTSPQVSPPASSTAAFRIMNDSVTIAGFDAIPGGTMPYGVYVSSDDVILSSVAVVSAGSINVAGIRLAGYSEVSDSAVTADSAMGINLAGSGNRVIRSAITSSNAFGAIRASYVSSNTIAYSDISNSGSGYVVFFDNGGGYNQVIGSTITGDSSVAALYFYACSYNVVDTSVISESGSVALGFVYGASFNNITNSVISASQTGGFGLEFSNNSASNTVSGSTILNTGGMAVIIGGGGQNILSNCVISGKISGLGISGSSSNTVSDCFISGETSVGVNYSGGAGNAISRSTVTAPTSALLNNATGVSILDSYLQGQTPVMVSASTGTVIGGSVLVSTQPGIAGLRLNSGNVGLDLSSTTVMAWSQGVGIHMYSGNSGVLRISSSTLTGGRLGLVIETQPAGAGLEFSSITFRGLAAGATAVQLLGGTPVATFTAFGFDDSGLGVNVDGALLSAGSRITMLGYAGPSTGSQHENDPAGYVDWVGEDMAGPTVAVLQPSTGSVLNALVSLSGTAADNVAVSSAEVSIQNIQDGQYWDGSAWGAGQAWNAVSIWPSSWTYTSVPAWVDNSSYVITGRAWDAVGNSGSSSSAFTYDATPPVTAITTPTTGTYASFTDLQGTAFDAHGVGLVQVSVSRLSDLQYWNGSGWAAGPLWNDSTGTVTWAYNGIANGDLASGTTYIFRIRGSDLAGNISGFSPSVSTFTYVVPPAGYPPPPGCSSAVSVKQDGSGDYTAIQAAVDAVPHNLSGDACVVVIDTGTYGEQVTVRNFVNNGYRLKIMADPSFVSSSPVVSPPAASTAAFHILSDSVTVQGISVLSAYSMPYGIVSSSAAAALARVFVDDTAGLVNGCGVSVSSAASVTASSVAMYGHYALCLKGSWSYVAGSTFSNTTSLNTLFMDGVASNTVVNNLFSNPGGNGVHLHYSNNNEVSHNVIVSSGSSQSGLTFDYSSDNLASDNDIRNLALGYGVVVFPGSHRNTVRNSTITASAVGLPAVYFANAFNNVFSDNYIYNRQGGAVTFSSSATANVLIRDYILGAGQAQGAVYAVNSSSNMVLDCYVQGSTGVYVSGSTGTVLGGSVVVSTWNSGVGLVFRNGSLNLSVSSSTFIGGPAGIGIYLGPGNQGLLRIDSNTVSGGAVGFSAAPQMAGAALSVSSITFASLTPGATAIGFTGWQLISTFTGAAFADPGIAVNVDGSQLAAGSRLLLRSYTGPKSGPLYENDPSGYVDWDGADIVLPTVGIVQPSSGVVMNALAQLAGTAADNVAVSSAEVSIQNLLDGQYWNGSAWGAGQAWSALSLWPSSWTYVSLPAWVDASSYVVTARAWDAAGNSAASSSVFTYDITPPVVAVTTPVTGTYAAFSQLSGTAADAHGITLVEVSVLRESDGQYWNGSAWAAGPLWNAATATTTWNYTGITAAALASGTTYMFNVRAHDGAGNISDPAPAVSSFTYQLPPGGALSPGVFSGVGVSSLTVNWGSTFDAGTTYYVNLSTWPGAAPFASSGTALAVSLDFGGLTPDTSYYGFVSTDAANFTASGSGVTLASAPYGVDFPAIGYSSATLAWNTGANPADTLFEFHLSTASDFTALTASGAVAGSSVVIDGLAEWSQYYGRVRAVNRLGTRTPYVEAGFYALTQFHSATGTVSGLAGAALGISSVNWTWSSGTVVYSDYFAYYDGASVFLGTAAFGATGAYDQAGLTPNSPHMLRVAGRNGLSQGPLAASATVYTLAAVPAAPAFGDFGYSTASFSWSANSNPAGTVYEYELSEFSDYSVLFSSSSGTAASALFSGLAQGSTYYARVRAVNAEGAPSVFAAAGPVITLAHVPTGLAAGLAGAAMGVSSINWTWTSGTVADAATFSYYSGAGAALGSTAFAATASYLQTGLTPNEPRMLRVAGVNGFGAGPLAASATVYTLAAVPADPVIADTGVSSAGVTLGLGGNPAGTALQLWRSADNIMFTSVYEGTDLSVADGALAECSDYYYKARARNGAGYYTAFTGVVSFTTMASTPSAASGLYAEALDGARIALSWDPSPSLGVTRYLLFYDNGTGTVDYASPLTVVSSTATAWTTPALTAGTTYKFAVRARGACGTEEKNTTLTASAQAVGVLSGVRASIKAPQSGKSIKGNRVTVMAEITLGLASQVSQVRFQYSPAGAGAWADITAANTNHPNPDTQAPYFVHWDADAMTPGAYDLRAIATDIYGVPDPSAPTITVNIDPVNYDTNETVVAGEQKKEQKICNTVNSTVQAGDDATTLLSKVVIPSGAVTDSTVAITLVSNPAALPAPPQGADNLNLSVKVNLSNGQSQLSSGKTAAITFTYKDDDGNGIVDGTLASVDRLKVYTASDAGGSWTALATSVDKDRKTITASTEHFSFFSVFASPAGGLGSVKVYPVPWQPGSGGRFDAAAVTFTGLPASARIKIYTINGELVRQLDVVSLDAGIKTWDGTNSVGHKAVSGIYLAFVKSGNDERVIKVAVER